MCVLRFLKTSGIVSSKNLRNKFLNCLVSRRRRRNELKKKEEEERRRRKSQTFRKDDDDNDKSKCKTQNVESVLVCDGCYDPEAVIMWYSGC